MSQFLKFDTKFRRANSPPCITARRGGCVTNQMVRSHRKRRSRGGFPSRHFLGRSATPPCGDARRGVRSSAISGSLCFPQAVWNPCRDQGLCGCVMTCGARRCAARRRPSRHRRHNRARRCQSAEVHDPRVAACLCGPRDRSRPRGRGASMLH